MFLCLCTYSSVVLVQNYDTTESKLRREFEVYGPIKRVSGPDLFISLPSCVLVPPWVDGSSGVPASVVPYPFVGVVSSPFPAGECVPVPVRVCADSSLFARRSTLCTTRGPGSHAATLSSNMNMSETCTVSKLLFLKHFTYAFRILALDRPFTLIITVCAHSDKPV